MIGLGPEEMGNPERVKEIKRSICVYIGGPLVAKLFLLYRMRPVLKCTLIKKSTPL